MNGGRRAYDILRGYINTEWERIQGVDSDSAASQELNDALAGPKPIATDGDAPAQLSSADEESLARQVLGVGREAGFEDIRAAYQRLSERCDAKNFPSGSEEARQADKIRVRVQKAFRILSDKFDSTETRFRSLEIE